MNRLKFKLIYIPIVIMLLGGALMIGLTDYITAGFTLDILRTSTFWTNIVTTNIGILCVILSILLIMIDKFKEENLEYLDAQKYIFDYYRSTKYQTAVFQKFSACENRNNKKLAYIMNIRKKYSKLKPSPKDLQIMQKGTEIEKESNKYCIKALYYETLMSSDYLENNIDKLHVHYNTITENLIFSGIPTTSNSIEYVTRHKGFKVAKDLLPKYLLSFAITVIIAGLSIDLLKGINIATVFKTVSKLFTISTQIYFAYNYSNKYSNEVVLHDINFRRSIIKKYDLWLVKETQKTKEVYS